MSEWTLPAPASLDLDPREREWLGLPFGPLHLRRSWPRDARHLLLEYAAADGSTIAGQWFRDPDRLEAVARETAEIRQAPSAIIRGASVLLQARGADRHLRALPPLVAQDGAALVVHRSERRAVVRLQASNGTRYAKVVRPDRVQAITATGCAAQHLAGTAFATPRLLDVDAASGTVVWSGLAGISLNDLLGGGGFVAVTRSVGEALKALHGATPPEIALQHGANQEIAWLKVWLERLQAFNPELHESLWLVAPSVFSALITGSPAIALLHGDFYDKQVLIDGAGRVGLVDFDTLATGEAAVDVANAVVHFELRALQGVCGPEEAKAAIAAFLDGYGWDPRFAPRLSAYADAARLRLACLYAFRPAWAARLPALLLERIAEGKGNRTATLVEDWGG